MIAFRLSLCKKKREDESDSSPGVICVSVVGTTGLSSIVLAFTQKLRSTLSTLTLRCMVFGEVAGVGLWSEREEDEGDCLGSEMLCLLAVSFDGCVEMLSLKWNTWFRSTLIPVPRKSIEKAWENKE